MPRDRQVGEDGNVVEGCMWAFIISLSFWILVGVVILIVKTR